VKVREADIADHACLGDGRTAALVTRGGELDWLCWPRFDAPPLFAALLDADRGGSWRLAPADAAAASRRYLPETNVLETRFETRDGTLRLIEAMTIAGEDDKRRLLLPASEVLRVVRCERGSVDVALRLEPRAGWARRPALVKDAGRLGWRIAAGRGAAWLRGDVPVANDGASLVARFRLSAGERVAFSLSYDEDAPAVLPPLGAAADERLARTVAWWREWATRARHEGPARDAVVRSALATKLLCFAPSGAVVAAPTTSLPERPGGELNWDYRFCWLRDAAFTARAFLALGYEEEASAFCDWLLHATRLTAPELRVLYDVYGRPPEDELTIPWLRGWRGSRPVRVRNAAAGQLQLDLYGEVIDAVAQLARAGRPLDRDACTFLRELGDHVCRRWREPDRGIWEDRGPPRHHVHSRVLCWGALDRLVDLAARGLLRGGQSARWGAERDAIRAEVEARGFSPRLGAYTRTLDGDSLDASALLLSWYGFHAASDPRMRATFERIRERLGVGPGLYLRYEESRDAQEGAFAMCGFWVAEHLARGGGTLAEAHAAFHEALRWRNDLGLFAEEVDPATGAALGNFPQAYTHVGIVNAAVSLAARERAERVAFSARRGRERAR
jgi:GH15 family glucan-1,4-alpha-glucosidase